MFEKLTRKLSKGAMENAKRTVKEEVVKSANDIFPTVVGVAFIGLLILANIPPQKPAFQQLTINNYFIK